MHQSVANNIHNIYRRWVNYDKSSKIIPFSFYKDGDHIEITGEKRVNKLLWAQSPELKNQYLWDEYKVSVIFKDIELRKNSSGITVTVWYDQDLDGGLDNNELNIQYSTIISEKQL